MSGGSAKQSPKNMHNGSGKQSPKNMDDQNPPPAVPTNMSGKKIGAKDTVSKIARVFSVIRSLVRVSYNVAMMVGRVIYRVLYTIFGVYTRAVISRIISLCAKTGSMISNADRRVRLTNFRAKWASQREARQTERRVFSKWCKYILTSNMDLADVPELIGFNPTKKRGHGAYICDQAGRRFEVCGSHMTPDGVTKWHLNGGGQVDSRGEGTAWNWEKKVQHGDEGRRHWKEKKVQHGDEGQRHWKEKKVQHGDEGRRYWEGKKVPQSKSQGQKHVRCAPDEFIEQIRRGQRGRFDVRN